jgi:hypothetical protein
MTGVAASVSPALALGRAGHIYDLASVLIDTPCGMDLRGETFYHARDLVQHTFGNQHAAEGETR